MEVRLPALHSKHLYPLSQLSRSQRTISSKTRHIFSPPTTKHRCRISSVVDMALKELWWRNLIASWQLNIALMGRCPARSSSETLPPAEDGNRHRDPQLEHSVLRGCPHQSLPSGPGNTEEEEKECFALRRLKNMKSSSFLKEKHSYSAFLSISAPKGSFVSTKMYLSHMWWWQS